jgi:NADH dehydrogenase (ubiquinone) 1 alpha subcomplex subunit 9
MHRHAPQILGQLGFLAASLASSPTPALLASWIDLQASSDKAVIAAFNRELPNTLRPFSQDDLMAMYTRAKHTAAIEKRGTYGGELEFAGGRSGVNNKSVAIFGASGFLGKYVTSEFGTAGYMGHLPNRGCELEMRHLKPMFDLGMSRFPFYSPRDKGSILEAIGDADYVVNLVGKNYETKTLRPTDAFPYVSYATNYTYQEAHVDVPRLIAECAKEAGCAGFVHVSSVAADPKSSSDWARTKWQGEAAVKKAFGKSAVIVRSSQMFGPEDKLLNWFAVAARMLPVVPLIGGGKALTRPVYMGDVADALFKIVGKYEQYKGEKFVVQGEKDYTYEELAEFVYDITEQKPNLVPLPKEVVGFAASVWQNLPNPMITSDMVELWSKDYVSDEVTCPTKVPTGATDNELRAFAEGALTLDNLNIKPTPIESVAFSYLHRFRAGGHFINTDGYHKKAETSGGSAAA